MPKALVLAALLALVTVPVTAQTLAEAAAKAKADRATGQHWPAPVAPKDIAPGATPADAAPAEGTSATTVTTTSTSGSASTSSTKPVTKDETYWRTRMRELTTRLHDDENYLLAAETSERALNVQAHRGIEDFAAIRDRRQLAVVENQWQDSVKEVARLKAAVKNDTRAKADFELEAHRAGVPPGWLILE
jgi:cytochrome c5